MDLPDVSERFTVVGVDVSHYQGKVQWDLLAAGNDFAFIKATEGRRHRDPKFIRNWYDAGRTGIPRGAYHFFSPDVAPEAQAKHFFKVVDLSPGDLPPVLDVEDRGTLTSAELVEAVLTWAEMAELRYGVKPIIYTGQHFYNRHLAGQLDDYPLWLARYDWSAPVTVCGREFQFWQYTDEGRMPGVRRNIDRNVFTGSLADMQRLLIPENPVADSLAGE